MLCIFYYNKIVILMLVSCRVFVVCLVEYADHRKINFASENPFTNSMINRVPVTIKMLENGKFITLKDLRLLYNKDTLVAGYTHIFSIKDIAISATHECLFWVFICTLWQLI